MILFILATTILNVVMFIAVGLYCMWILKIHIDGSGYLYDPPPDKRRMKRLRFDDSLQTIMDYMKTAKWTIYWSDLYYAMRREKLIGRMSASEFGKLIEEHGGPSAQVVRKSGDYNMSRREIDERHDQIGAVAGML